MFSKYNCFSVSRFNKIMSIFGFIVILLALFIIVINSSAGAYEFSIYEAYPWYFWALLIIAIVIGQLILLNSAFSKYETTSWLAGFLIIVISNSILLFMPVIRGYFIHGRHDVLTHIGYMIDIETNFSISSNPYPILHIWSFIIKSISGLSYNHISMLIPVFLSLFYICSWYFLGKLIFKRSNVILFMLSISSILLFGGKNIMVSPHGETLLFIPFFLYIFFKSKVSEKPVLYKILLVIISFFVVFSHPLITILLIITLTMSDYPIYFNKNKDFTDKVKKSNDLVLILLCSFLMWSSYLYLLTSNLKLILNNLIFDDGVGSELGRYSDSINSVDIPFLDLIEIFLKTYGSAILLGILTFICILLTFILWRKYHIEIDYYHKFSIFGWLFFVFISLLFLSFSDSFGFMRIYQYSMFFSFILIPSSIDMFVKRMALKENSHRLKFLPILYLFLVLIVYFSTLNLFYSPFILKVDQQTPESEFTGMKEFYNVKNNSQPILELGIVNFRVHNAIYGMSQTKKEHIRYNNPVIEHFDYINNSSISDYYDETSYLLISDVGKYQNQKIFPHIESKWDFVPEDFVNLNNDIGVIKFYSNKFVEIYVVKPNVVISQIS